MMKLSQQLFALLTLALLLGCTEADHADEANLHAEELGVSTPSAASFKIKSGAANSSPLFVGIDLAKLKEPTKTAVLQAIADFDRVKGGLPPICKAAPDSVDSDGGTAVYECEHYKLMVMKSIYQVGDEHGYIYGPIITFPGDYPISDVRFYTTSELQSLLKQNGT